MRDGYNRRKGGAQYLHLAADQSLAFVRTRDTLPGIDLGRTKRQQAVIDYVIWKLKHDGVFGDLGTLNALLGTASKYLITDSTFNLFDFATNMRALTGRHVVFQTLPISGQVNEMPLNGSMQDVNTINVPYLQQFVKNAFYPQPATQRTAGKASGTKKTALDPGAFDGHGGRLQRQRRVRAGRQRLPGARRLGLQGWRRRERVSAVADPQAGHAGVLRRRGVGERGAHRDRVRHDGDGADVPARRSRRGATGLDRDRGARRPHIVSHVDREHPAHGHADLGWQRRHGFADAFALVNGGRGQRRGGRYSDGRVEREVRHPLRVLNRFPDGSAQSGATRKKSS